MPPAFTCTGGRLEGPGGLLEQSGNGQRLIRDAPGGLAGPVLVLALLLRVLPSPLNQRIPGVFNGERVRVKLGVNPLGASPASLALRKFLVLQFVGHPGGLAHKRTGAVSEVYKKEKRACSQGTMQCVTPETVRNTPPPPEDRTGPRSTVVTLPSLVIFVVVFRDVRVI